MNDIDWEKVFYSLDIITGLPITQRRNKWVGSCYMNGSDHKRWDKLVAKQGRDGAVLITENGGDTIPLFKWMLQYGGCKNEAEVFEKLTQISRTILNIPPPPPQKPTRFVKYISREQNPPDPLFLYLEKHFGREKVETAYKMLNITSMKLRNGEIGTCFWYVNKDNNVCYDKTVLYNQYGKRNKKFGGLQRFRPDSGYRHECYFGSHLLASNNGGKKILVVESEKTALLVLLYWGRIALATGGISKLKEIDPKWVLLPDRDAFGKWSSLYPKQCSEWWELYPEWICGDKDDIGDYIMYKLENK